MLREEILIAEGFASRQWDLGVINTSAQLMPANNTRMVLILPPLAANRVTLGFGVVPADQTGFVIATGNGLMILRYAEFGEMMRRNINAILQVAGPQAYTAYEIYKTTP